MSLRKLEIIMGSVVIRINSWKRLMEPHGSAEHCGNHYVRELNALSTLRRKT